MIARIFLGLAVTIALVGGSTAQESETSKGDAILNFGVLTDGDFRPKFLLTLETYCQQVLSALPTNTPAEDAWIASEEKTKDTEQLRRLFSSKEYSQSVLKRTFSDCKETIALLDKIQFMKEGGNERVRLEARQFIKLALKFNVSLEPYLSKVELNKDIKAKLGDGYLAVVRQGLLTAAVKTLQDVPRDNVLQKLK